MGAEDELLEGIRAGLVGWYDFVPRSRVLCLGRHREVIAAYLRKVGLQVKSAESSDILRGEWRQENSGRYDVIVSIGDLERTEEPEKLLDVWHGMLEPEGRLLLALNNRLGLKYFCGDRDPYTKRVFDGVENYRHMKSEFTGRMYAKSEIEEMLLAAGWDRFHFFSVLSDLDNPAFIFAEDYLPNEDMANRLFPTYNYPDTVFLEEEGLHDSLIENGMFHTMANAYFIECSPAGKFSDVLHATCSMERGKEEAFFTIIYRSGQVEKRVAYPEGRPRLQQMARNIEALKSRNIPVIEGALKGDRYVMPYIQCETGQIYLKKLLVADQKQFLCEMDKFRDTILRSSEIVKPDQGDGEGPILKDGFWDMVPLNSFYIDGEFHFFDQEFCLTLCPANYIVYRMLCTFYGGNSQFDKIIPINQMYERYGLIEHLSKWQEMEWKNISSLRKEQELSVYHAKCRRNMATVNSNRQRMNYSSAGYQRVFVDIFRGTDAKDLVVFGSGRYAERFITLYGKEHPVAFVVDNDQTRWGKKLLDISIMSPETLTGTMGKNCKVLICIKNYMAVVRQLEEIGVIDYAIFDPNFDYPKRMRPFARPKPNGDKAKKKYRVGYVAGVFDLFHIGHLNLLRRAKEQCEYLIVGVVSDRQVREMKKVEPFVPFTERMEMVCSCRYVDEVREIPFEHPDTDMAWQMYHFDVQFSGSDYEHDPVWLAKKKFLEERGATMVFFPYTESTSSTKLKKLIEKKLL